MSSTVIKWAEFPEIVGQTPNLKFEVSFPSNYADNERYVRDFSRLVKICVGIGVLSIGLEPVALASTDIDMKADELYKKFISMAAVIIAFKGGWDILHKALKEDFEGAKKISLQYLIIFGLLIGLPLGLSYVEGLFAE